MINKDTILSVYTDKQTLLEYLTKIETALDKAVLTSSQLVYEGGNNYHFKFVFEDGSSIETPSITLVQPISKVDFLANGNSVHFVFTLMDGETITTQTINLLKPVTAAAVRDGILYLTLSDGTEVSAGSITASFGASTFNGDVLVKGNFHQTDGNAILGGNAEVDGNLQVNGSETSTENISADGFIQTDNYARPLTEADRLNYSFTHAETAISENVTAGAGTYSIVYGLARTSNGKLNIVIFGKVTITADLTISLRSRLLPFITIPISANIGSHIFPIEGASFNLIDSKQADLFKLSDNVPPTSEEFTKKIYFALTKSDLDNSISCGLALSSGTIPVGSYAFRIEENITL